MRHLAILLAVLLASGCTTITSGYSKTWKIDPVPGALLTPPFEYRRWHAELEACLEMERSFERVSWRVVEEIDWRANVNDEWVAASGLWIHPNKIYLTYDFLLNPRAEYHLVRHELIHYITQLPHPEVNVLISQCVM